jgi:translation elongation factor EF-1beta
MYRTLPATAKIIRGRVWNRVYYNDTSTSKLTQDFDFSYTDLVIHSKYKNGSEKRDTASFSFGVVALKTYIKIAKKETSIDPFFKGDWEILKLEKKNIPGLGKKYILQIARNGALPDNNPTTVEGGLNMMEFVEN